MTIQLHAQPYDMSANGFYFENAEEFKTKIKNNRNDYGDLVEEYELQFIDGERIDCELASAWGVHQGNYGAYFDAVSDWDDDSKTRYIIAVGECGYSHDQIVDDPQIVDIHQVSTMRELAEQFIDEGLFGEIPDHLTHYIDHDAIAHDLAMDYTQTEINGQSLVYRCN